MKRKKYTSLNAIRAEKTLARIRIQDGVTRLKNDVTDCFVPTSNVFLSSSNKYMNYIGYAITAYKVATTFKGMFGFFAKWL